jgi:uncharacterized protein (TIGR02453 family)
MPAGFDGFPEEGLRFLRGLKKNNNREWFQPRKEIFESQVKAPMERLVESVNSHLIEFAPMYITEPRKAIYRIYRDTRFSKDKTPYKTHIAASLIRQGMPKHRSGGLYCSVGPDEVEVAGGMYMPGPEELKQVREYLLEHYEEFAEIVENRTLGKLMGGLWGEPMARMPKGVPPDHPAGEYLRRKHWVFYDTRLDPKLAVTGKLVVEIVKRFRAMTPFIDFINRALAAKRAKHPPFSVF